MGDALPPGQPRAAILAEVARALRVVEDGASVVIGCSGGPDSTALAFLTAEARDDLVIELVHVAHGLRGAAIDAEEGALVGQHAAWLGTRSRSVAVDVRPDGGGIEAAARSVRLAALEQVADERGAAAILLGHTADDQAETLLLRLARGTGLDGLAGMRLVRGRFVRPLLRLRRGDVRGFVAGDGLPTADDESNDDARFGRVVVRHEVLPSLARVASDPVGALSRLAELAHADATALEAAARQAVPIESYGEVTALDRLALGAAHPALARRRIRAALGAHQSRAPDAGTVARVRTADVGTRETLPGALQLEVTRAQVLIGRSDGPEPEPRPLVLPGVTPWPATGVALTTRTPEPADAAADRGQLALGLPGTWTPRPMPPAALAVLPGGRIDRVEVWLPAGLEPLTVRPPRPGDRIRTAGGTRRLAVVLRDARVPRLLRGRWPVLVSGDRVVWVPGIGVDAEVSDHGRRAPEAAVTLTSVDRRSADRRVDEGHRADD
ncbi:MAG: tRNA lysidine(34) synthetase TilS [Nitriliruptoraceae bacterium]